MENKYIFVGKSLFFPKERILVVGDLHLGYESALKNQGVEIPLKQFEEAKEELENIIKYLKATYGKLTQIIFLGDIKHHFNFMANEKEEIKKLIHFLRKYFEEKDIILIRGNHEKNETNGKYLDYYLIKDIAFVHGHKEFQEIYDKNINLIVMGHLHPTVTISDEMKIKKEKYKCFLVGRYKKKDIVILPSFLSITEGVSQNDFSDEKGYDFSIIPSKELENFEVFIAQNETEAALDFGKLKEI